MVLVSESRQIHKSGVDVEHKCSVPLSKSKCPILKILCAFLTSTKHSSASQSKSQSQFVWDHVIIEVNSPVRH